MTPAHGPAHYLEPAVGVGSGVSPCEFRRTGVLTAGDHENRGAKLTTSANAHSADFAMSECESERVSEW